MHSTYPSVPSFAISLPNSGIYLFEGLCKNPHDATTLADAEPVIRMTFGGESGRPMVELEQMSLADLLEVPYQFASKVEAEGLIIPNKEWGRRFHCYQRKLASWLAKLYDLRAVGMAWAEVRNWCQRRYKLVMSTKGDGPQNIAKPNDYPRYLPEEDAEGIWGGRRCIAWSRRNGRRCRNAAMRRKAVCRLHGGRSLCGFLHPGLKDGWYSKDFDAGWDARVRRRRGEGRRERV